jgi:hypothetical protein
MGQHSKGRIQDLPHKYKTRTNVTQSDKHTSILLCQVVIYSCKMLHSTKLQV